MLIRLIAVATLILGLSGCGNQWSRSEVKDADLVGVSFSAVEDLMTNLKQPLPHGSLVVVNGLVNVDNLDQNLAFGRIVSDQLTSALHQYNYRVMDMDLPKELFTKNEAGILRLPETAKQALSDVHADALVYGTYAVGRNHVYVSLRVVELLGQNVISSTDYSVPMGPDTRALTTLRPQPAASPAKP